MEAFKQPQLCQTIVNLRQEKKLTQEELVERCNLNVRTLQRIEAGEVTPRDYTVRAILTALEYDIKSVEDNFIKRTILRRLHWAWIAGIVYFVLGFTEVAVDYLRFEAVPVYFPLIYISIKTMVIGSSLLFFTGFVEIGNYHKHSLIKITAYLMFGSLLIIELYDIVSIFSPITEEEFVLTKGVEAVAFGAIDILFGIALIQLRKQFRTSALIAGIFEIIVGTLFVTFFLAFVGLIFMIPAILLEVVILYKFYDKIYSLGSQE